MDNNTLLIKIETNLIYAKDGKALKCEAVPTTLDGLTADYAAHITRMRQNVTPGAMFSTVEIFAFQGDSILYASTVTEKGVETLSWHGKIPTEIKQA